MTDHETGPAKTFGLSQKTFDQISAVFASYGQIERAVLYGSRAKGTYRSGSDIDLALVGEQLTEKQLLEIETRLDDLLLPYGIDLCRLETIESPALIEHINRVGKVFYKASTPAPTKNSPRSS